MLHGCHSDLQCSDDEVGAYEDKLPYQALSQVSCESFSELLFARLVAAAGLDGRQNDFFLPRGSLDEILTRDVLLEDFDLEAAGADGSDDRHEELIEFILQRAKTLFAICVMIDLGNLLRAMAAFKQANFSDQNLPVSREDIFGLSCFSELAWRHSDKFKFLETQWTFLAPVFSRMQINLEPEHILPFTSLGKEVKEGTFGRVYQVTLHPSHQISADASKVAIKEITPITGGDTMRAWEAEAKMLQMIGDLQHPSISNIKAVIKKGRKNYFVFDWADGGSLRDLWKVNSRPHLSQDLVSVLIKQLRGLADGLVQLHNYVQRGHHTYVYRHGNLKPENILVFHGSQAPSNPDEVGVWKIGDLGDTNFTKQHHLTTNIRSTSTRRSKRFGTVRYEPPEMVQLGNTSRSRFSDIWAMGCISLELIIWLLYGYDELERFNEEIEGPGRIYNPYFELVGGTPEARVHHRVAAWMDKMMQDPDCQREQTAIGDLLSLVRRRLLVVALPTRRTFQPEPTHSLSGIIVTGPGPKEDHELVTRATAQEFRDALDDIIARGEKDAKYWFATDWSHKTLPASVKGKNYLRPPIFVKER